MRIHYIATVVSLSIMLAGCGGGGSCKSACKKIAKCLGISLDGGAKAAPDAEVKGGSSDTSKQDSTSWTCPLSSECSPKESCYAKCIDKASCDAITGKDQQAAGELAKCQVECDNKQYDATIPDAGPPRGDATKPDSCVPECGEKACGPDGCGGSCGSCTSPEVCNTKVGECVTSCTSDCSDKECGDDGCGGSCGTCSSGYVCDTYYQCQKSCTPYCSGKQCGDNGCGGTCGTCGSGYYCDNYYQCQKSCSASCSGKQCGDDGCGGSCGTCSSGSYCDTYYQCQPSCTASCAGKVCGDDGCGGSCGSCSGGYVCSLGQCYPPGACSTKEYAFDSGTMEGLNETHSDSVVRWQVVNKRHQSPTYALYYGDASATNYVGSGSNYGTAYLPSVTIPATGGSSLVFWAYMDVEASSSYDILTVKLGSTTLWTKTSTFPMKKWEEVVVDLATVAGQSGQLAFEFKTNDGSANSTEGVYLDSIVVQLGCP